jgi:hypothetical protein
VEREYVFIVVVVLIFKEDALLPGAQLGVLLIKKKGTHWVAGSHPETAQTRTTE